MIEAWLREGDQDRGDSMRIGDIVAPVQPEGGLPAGQPDQVRRKHLTMAVWPDPSYRSCRIAGVGSVHPYTRISMITHRFVIRLEVTSVKRLTNSGAARSPTRCARLACQSLP